jgi:signal transduction histidine kinase
MDIARYRVKLEPFGLHRDCCALAGHHYGMALVLVADNQSANRELFVRLLRYAGHRAREAGDGHQALDVIRAESPDLVITDVHLPGVDGRELVRRLRADPGIRQPRVVFCTAADLVGEARELAASCGVFTVIANPAEPHDILSAITVALERDVDGPEMSAEEFGRTLRLLNQRLLEKMGELDEANVDRSRLLTDVVRAHEAERTRIASDIHDDSIQVMSAAALRLEMLGDDLVESGYGDAIGEVAEKARQAVGRLRRLIFDLSPRGLESGGLGPVIRAYLREVCTEAGLQWNVEDRLRRHLPDEVEAVLYRIAQEAIRNAEKHAKARNVSVTLSRRDGGSLLRIADDGMGFSAGGHGEHRPGHVGLPSMRERAAVVGGSLRLETAPGEGCVIEVWVPDEVSPSASASSMPVAGAARNGQPVAT